MQTQWMLRANPLLVDFVPRTGGLPPVLAVPATLWMLRKCYVVCACATVIASIFWSARHDQGSTAGHYSPNEAAATVRAALLDSASDDRDRLAAVESKQGDILSALASLREAVTSAIAGSATHGKEEEDEDDDDF